MLTQFAIRLICGMSLVWCIMPRGQVTSGFFRIQMLVTLGLSVLAAMAAAPTAALTGGQPVMSAEVVRWTAVVLGLLSFFGSVMWTLERRAAGGRYAFAIAGISAVTAVLGTVSAEDFQSWAGNLAWMTELSMAAVSGAAVGGMLLGHWYLTAPTMSTSPLNKVNVWLGLVATDRLILGLISLFMFWPFGVVQASATPRTGSTSAASWNSTYTVWLTLEWIGGILGPLLVCWMVIRILKYKNTQSATGVLFVGVILAFLGEMTGSLLRREMQLPF